MNEIKKLREEFDQLRKQNLECEEGCDTDFEEDFPDYIIEITTKMLSPERCGINFSKKDIQFIAAQSDERITLKQRQRMLTDTLKSIFTIEEMEKLFSTINSVIDIKLSRYTELSLAFPSSAKFFEPHNEKAIKFKGALERILTDNREQ